MKNIYKDISRYRSNVINKSMMRQTIGQPAWELALGRGIGGPRNGVYYAVSEGVYGAKMFVDATVF